MEKELIESMLKEGWERLGDRAWTKASGAVVYDYEIEEAYREGYRKGCREGRRKVRRKVAKSLKNFNMAISEIAEVTGLSEKEIESL